MDLTALSRPFRGDDLEWRIQRAGVKQTGEPWAIVVPYVTARAIMARLDEVCGPANWQSEIRPLGKLGKQDGVAVGIGVRFFRDLNDREGYWVWKWDAAPATDIEAVKGAASGALKRAAVSWGMGRDLYGVGDLFARIHEGGKHYTKTKVKVRGQEQEISFKWDAPELPGGPTPTERAAVAAGEHPATAAAVAAQAAQPTQKQLALYDNLVRSHHFSDDEKAQFAKNRNRLSRERMKDALDYLTQVVKDREATERNVRKLAESQGGDDAAA